MAESKEPGLIVRRLLWSVSRAGMSAFFILGFRLRVFGTANVPERGGLVIASNHQSYFDPPLLMVALKRHGSFMARNTLFDNRLFGALIRGLNAFPVRRGAMDKQAVREAIRRLKNGWCLVLFPEGTRTHNGEIAPLKPGVLSIAERAGVPIVPAVIEGAFQAWPRTGGLRAHPISVWYGRPLTPKARKGMSRSQIACSLRSQMRSAQAALRKIRARTA